MANVDLTSINSIAAMLALAIVFAAGASAFNQPKDDFALDRAASATAPTGTGCSLGSYVGSFDDAYGTALGRVARAKERGLLLNGPPRR